MRSPSSKNHATIEEARAAKVAVEAVFERLAPVVGIGLAQVDDGFAVKVNLGSEPGPDARIPATVKGVPVIVEVVGRIVKRRAPAKRRAAAKAKAPAKGTAPSRRARPLSEA